MAAPLSFAEVCRQQKTNNFAAGFCGDEWIYAWVHKRGALDKGSSDGGHDLIMMRHGGFPLVVISGAKSLSAPSFAGPRFVVVKDGKEALVGSADTLELCTWLTLPAGETFVGAPTWAGADVLFATSGGTPKRDRLHAIAAPSLDKGAAADAAAERRTLFTAAHGGGVMSWDRSPVAPHPVLVVHRLANAMLAELVLVGDEDPRVIARDGRVEYSRPQANFLADGRIVARLNLPSGDAEVGGMPREVKHGLWLLGLTPGGTLADSAAWAPVHAGAHLGEHGSYDVCSTSYANAHGLRDGFVLDAQRRTLVIAARAHDPARGMADELVAIDLIGGAEGCWPTTALASGKGCHVPVALASGSLVYHFRSPTEAGDLWNLSEGARAAGGAVRVTHTMPVALRAKLRAPEEVVVGGGTHGGTHHGTHALLFRPPPSEAPRPALVWAHGGPMAAFGFDYNPIAAWLASLGYFVCVPNFAGSVGFGPAHMDRVFGAGCGVADLDDCVACAHFLRDLAGVDARRGVAIAGHSWGGFLALRALTAPGARDAFAVGIACAGIADWFCQQRHTEVRYYDYALMGGWVYEPAVTPRAKEQSPLTRAAELQAPLLVLHGEDDTDVPFAQARAFVEAARAARRGDDPAAPALEFVSYAGEGHGMGGWKPATQADALNRISAFLRIHLKPWDFTDNPHGDLTAY